jgi:hypothetical protein
MNLRQNLIDIFNVVGNDKPLMRILYYDKDPLNPLKADVDTLPDYQTIKKTRIMRSPKSDDITTQQICRVCMYMGGRVGQFNKQTATQTIQFDVFVHVDKFDLNDARSLWICDRIAEILQNQNITGMGKMDSDKVLPIGNCPTGYIGYKMIFTFGSVK